MKFKFISVHRETFKVGRLCALLNVSRSGYYCWLKRPKSRRSIENHALEDKIRVLHAASHCIYGAPKIHQDLIDEGVGCSKNRVARIMREAGIRSRIRKKFKATTNSCHNLPVAPNLLNQNFDAPVQDAVWVSDITYIHTNEGWLYLATVLDLFDRRVVGWSASSRMSRQLAIDALKMALGRRTPSDGLIHHSDRGSQYASRQYQNILSKHGITCSMSRKGNCYDNAVAESFFHLLKTEWVHHHQYLSRSEAISSLFYYIEIFYNRKRRHSTLGYATPHEYNGFSLAA